MEEKYESKPMRRSNLHDLRRSIDALIYLVEIRRPEELDCDRKIDDKLTFAEEQLKVKLIEAKMWAGKCLEYSGSKLPKELRDNCKVRETTIDK